MPDILIKLLETREEFYTTIIRQFRTNNLKVIENMIMGFEKLAVAISNISVSSSQTNTDLLNKLDTLTSCIKKTNAIFNTVSSEIHLYDFTRIFKDGLNGRKLKFCQAFRSQELPGYYNSLIRRDDKFVPDRFVSDINKNAFEFEKQLKRDDRKLN